MKLIDKAAVVEEIEKQGAIQPQLSWFTDKLVQIINSSVEMKEVDLEKEIIRISKNEYFDFTDWKSIARHFFELGLKAAQKGE